MNAPLLEARSVSKTFPGVRALNGVDLRLDRGEVLAVIGENGAGKSTLMKILAGVQAPDEGELRVGGRVAHIRSVHDALGLGIALIHQELNLADNLDVGANIFLGREPRRFGMINEARIAVEARRVLAHIGLDVDPKTIVASLPIGRQQMVEIAKALSVDARVLIMDEPTSSLSRREAAQLFEVVRGLRERGVSVIYISHRLAEVGELADRVIVLRDGAVAGELSREEIDHDAMVRLMVGRDVSRVYEHSPHPSGEVVLSVRGLRTSTWPVHALDFEVCAGEIVGVAGLVGAGRTELLESLFGVTPPAAGMVEVAGRRVRPGDPVAAIRAGVALVPEDRKLQGLILDMSVRENLGLASLSRDSHRGFLDDASERALSARMIEMLDIRTAGENQFARHVSGGNQQKIVIGKWLATGPKVLLLDEPTRGIDVGAKREIYRMMEDLSSKGVAILFASSELEEIICMSDRVLVMHEGAVAGVLGRSELGEESVMHLATRRAAS